MTKHFWDDRFKAEGYYYGDEPNAYLKDRMENMMPGKILFPMDGEGRNSVYAAEKGWESFAFDISLEGKKKALYLAIKKIVLIDYQIADIQEVSYEENTFDALALIYAHLPVKQRREAHQKMATYLKQGGILILEAFSKNQVENQKNNPRAGGPKDIDWLYDLEDIKADFMNFEWIEAVETTTDLSEGEHHVGKANVVRLFGKKI